MTAPEVLCFATEEGQAGNTYENVAFMLRNGAAFRQYRLREPDIGVGKVSLPGGGIISPETSASGSADGGKSTFVIFDETHLWHTRQLLQLHATVRRNLGKRKAAEPWGLETSTMYAAGEGSVAEASHAYAEQLAEKGRDDLGLLFDHREAPWVEDLLYDDEALRAAIVHVYGDAAGWVDVDRIMAEVRDPQSSPEDSRRYWLNQRSRTSDSWIDRGMWDALGEPEELAPGELVTLGFDGAMFDDATSIVACRVSDGKLFHVATWERPLGKAGEGWQVPEEEVDAKVAETMAAYSVWRLYGDPPYWQDAMARWAREWPETVREWWTNRDTAMAAAVERLATAIRTAAQAEAKLHDGNLTLARHMGNARRKVVRAGVILRKERPGSPKKIDAAMAAVLAYEARGDAIAAGANKPKRRGYASW